MARKLGRLALRTPSGWNQVFIPAADLKKHWLEEKSFASPLSFSLYSPPQNFLYFPLRAYVNEQHYFTFRNERLTDPAADYKQWPFDRPFYLLLNIAVGWTWGGAQGIDRSIRPQPSLPMGKQSYSRYRAILKNCNKRRR